MTQRIFSAGFVSARRAARARKATASPAWAPTFGGLRFRVLGVQGLGFRVRGFRLSGVGFGVSSFRFRGLGSGHTLDPPSTLSGTLNTPTFWGHIPLFKVRIQKS